MLLLGGALTLVTGCPDATVTPPVKPVSLPTKAAPTPTPEPSPTPKPAPSVTPSPSPAPALTGSVDLKVASVIPFNKSAYKVLAVPTGSATITLSTLEDTPLTGDGKDATTTTNAEGRFSLAGPLSNKPYVIHATFAGNHRLSAVVLPEVSEVTIDEASTMIVATLRNQIRGLPPDTGAEPGRKTLLDLTFANLSRLLVDTRFLMSSSDVPTTGQPPTIPNLQPAGGTALRQAAVLRFGSQVTTTGDSAPNRVSDTWRLFLGYRPLALSRTVGGGTGGEGALALEGALKGPIAAAADADGNMFISERDGHRIRIVPSGALPATFAATQPMAVGRLHTLLGSGEPVTLESFNTVYQPTEQASATDPAVAPKVFNPDSRKAFPLITPYRLLVEKAGTSWHLFFTSVSGNRVLFVPGVAVSRFGRNFQPGRLYTIAGTGAVAPAANDTELGNNVPATSARLFGPTGLARDAAGNLFVLDAGTADSANHGLIRVIRRQDGRILTLPMLKGGAPFKASGAKDLLVVENGTERFLYVADTLRHAVFRLPLPTAFTTVSAAEIQPVLGVSGQSGTVDATQGALPEQLKQADGVVKEAILLNGPTSLAVDPFGNLLVADAGNGRLLMQEKIALAAAGKVHVIGGAYKPETGAAAEGDARLVGFSNVGLLGWGPNGNLLVPDVTGNVVRKLWTARGVL
jgi:hypothetical protein